MQLKITLFSSNQPRHLNLVRLLSNVSTELFFISEVNTVFPGTISDFFDNSKIMQNYFSEVLKAEQKIFNNIKFMPKNVNTLSIKYGDLSLLSKNQIESALSSDLYIVYGSSYIKGWLLDTLIEKSAINVHLGLSPYYRGTSCNFWALFDQNPSYVGATIHMLARGLDNGDMIFHCLPKFSRGETSFDFSMKSVAAAHQGLVYKIKTEELLNQKRVAQKKESEIRYSRNKDFTDKVAEIFLKSSNKFEPGEFTYPNLIDPYFL